MIRGTTPTLTFNLPFDTSIIKSAYITVRCNEIEIEKGLESCVLTGKKIQTKLTQEETLSLPKNKEAKIQLRVLTVDDDALATDIYIKPVLEILKEGVI